LQKLKIDKNNNADQSLNSNDISILDENEDKDIVNDENGFRFKKQNIG